MHIFDKIEKRLRFIAREGLEIGPRHRQIQSVEYFFNGEIRISLGDFMVYLNEVDCEIEINSAILFLGINPPKSQEIESTITHLIQLVEKEIGAFRVRMVTPQDRD
ncbi:hypothetical protein [Larkinella punicea]|uniref:Uncharacterized protein n=1 Tax=Larkinella punicea TaxID=2315727 RepID=A0A368JT56_9BACT|nr:hypothetical protein [Larkinella punicea]RCR70632.1 hypothetical protein DUE52_06725 [Larkinella punicea]